MTAKTESVQGRRILLEPNIGRPDVVATVAQVVQACAGHGIEVRMLEDTSSHVAPGIDVETIPDTSEAAVGCELVLVLGGDGTFLRACQYANAADVPVLGVNLGHIGFLAESEVESLSGVVEQIAARDYRVVERMTVEATIMHGDTVLGRDWALNEVSIEKVSRQGVLEASVEIDGRPVSGDGVRLRRCGAVHADRVHCLRFFCRRTYRVARTGRDSGCSQQCTRAVRTTDGGRAHLESRGGDGGAFR